LVSLFLDHRPQARQPPIPRRPIAEPSPILELRQCVSSISALSPTSDRSDAKADRQKEQPARPGQQALNETAQSVPAVHAAPPLGTGEAVGLAQEAAYASRVEILSCAARDRPPA